MRASPLIAELPQFFHHLVQRDDVVAHIDGEAPGVASLGGDFAGAAGHFVRGTGRLRHIARDLGGGGALLLDRRGDRSGGLR